jgi:hypothetical protein
MSDLCKQSVTLCNIALLNGSCAVGESAAADRRFSDSGKTQSPPGHLWGSSMKSNEELTVL